MVKPMTTLADSLVSDDSKHFHIKIMAQGMEDNYHAHYKSV